MDQMDVIKRFIQNYTLTFMYATTANDIDEAFKANKVYTYRCTVHLEHMRLWVLQVPPECIAKFVPVVSAVMCLCFHLSECLRYHVYL